MRANYTYELIRDKQFGIMIMESIDGTKNDESDDQDLDFTTVAQGHRWNAYDLIHKNVDQMSKEFFWSPKTTQLESFQRTKTWLENHPELLL